MYIKKELKLNKFRMCSIPSNREYFSRFGFAAMPAGSYTGDEAAPQPMNKIDSIEDYRAYAESEQQKLNNQNPQNHE